MVVLWHMQVSTTQIFDITSPMQQVHTEISPLTAEFDIDHQLMQDPASITVTYSYNSKETLAGGDVYATAIPTGTSISPDWRTNPSRNISNCNPPEPSVCINDPGCSDQENTFNFGIYVGVPITLTIYPPGADPIPKSLGTGLGVEFYIPYDFTQTNQSGTVQPPGLPYGATYTEVLLPPPGGTGTQVTTYTVDYTLTTKDLELTYTPLNQDISSSTEGGYQGYQTVTPNLASSVSGWRLHANNQLQPTVEGADVTSDFIVWRWVRVWVAPVGSDGNRSAPYAGAVAPGSPNLPWLDDNLPDDTGQRQPSWNDVPGGPSLPSDPSAWPTVRQLNEFVASVNNYPEFGFLYYIIVMDVMPNAYRVQMFPAQSITADDWCTIKSLDVPYMDEGPIDGDPAGTKTVQPPVASASNTVSSFGIDTGWVDCTGDQLPTGQ
jgi:hypothetical protein